MNDKRVYYSELALFLVTIIWGLGFPITDIAITAGFGENTIMFGRFFTASIILTIIFYKRLKHISKSIIIYGIITGAFLFLGFYFQTLGNVYTTSSNNGFITQLNIVFVPVLYYIFFRKKVNTYNIISIVVAILGMYILSAQNGSFSSINIGDFYTLICAIMIAFNVTTGSYFQKKYNYDPALFVLINIYTSLALSTIFMISFDTLPNIGVVSYWPLLVLGIFNTALGFLVQSYALKLSLPTRVSLIVALESVFAAVASVLILDESVTVALIVGGVLIIFGVLITELKPFHRKFQQRKKVNEL